MKCKRPGLAHGIFCCRNRHGRSGVAEHPSAGGIPDGVGPRYGRLQVVVDSDAAVSIQLDPDLIQSDGGSIGLAGGN